MRLTGDVFIMNLVTMEYFIALANERSFTQASEKLNITQQTLSAHIAGVEKELGVQLVERTVPLKLTYAGEVFLNYAKGFQDSKRKLMHEMGEIRHDERGRLRVGVASTRGHIIMPRVIARFREVYPHVAVELHEAENFELIEGLKSGYLDIIVAYVPFSQPGFDMEVVYKDEVVLCASEHLLQSIYGEKSESVIDQVIKDQSLLPMKACPFMLVGKRDVSGEIARQMFEKDSLNPDFVVTSKNVETLLDLAEEGVGACFCPGEVVVSNYPEDSHANLRVIRLGKIAHYPVHAAFRKDDTVWSVVKSFREILDEEIQDIVVDRSLV